MYDRVKDKSLMITALLVLVILTFGIVLIPDEPQGEEETPPQKLHMRFPTITYTPYDPTPVFEIKANYEKAEKVLKEHKSIQAVMDTVMLPMVEMKLTDLGKYYVTGYTSWELGGSVATASGATCHKAASYEDSFFNPTTCAADVWGGYHDFGDTLFIEQFGCFVVEDTGSAVLGKHIDLYYGLTYEDNQDALKITGYYTVYSVEFIYGEVPATNYDIQGQVADLVIGWKLSDEMKGIETDTTKGPCYFN